MSEFYIGALVGMAEDHDARGVVVDSHPERGWLVWWTWQEAARWHKAAALWLRPAETFWTSGECVTERQMWSGPVVPNGNATIPEDELASLRVQAGRWQEVAEHCDCASDDHVLGYILHLEANAGNKERWLWASQFRGDDLCWRLVDLREHRISADLEHADERGELWAPLLGGDLVSAIALPLADAQRICEAIAEAIARRDSNNQGENP